MTREEIVTAATAVLAAGNVAAYELDDLAKMKNLPANFAELHLSLRSMGVVRQSGRSDVLGWRLQVRAVGSSMGNVNTYLDRIHAALYRARLGTSSRLDAGPTEVPSESGNHYSALAEFTFTA